MSKGSVQRKSSLKRDPSIGDDEATRRRPCYQLIEKERQRKNQLGILQEILYNERSGNIKSIKLEKFVPKNNTIRNRKNPKTRPTSAKSEPEEGLNRSINFAVEETVEHKPFRVSRSNRKDVQQHRVTRSQSRPHSSGIRSVNNVSFISDTESNVNASPRQLKKLLARLSSDLNDLESITGFKPNKNDPSTSLATTLIRLTDHVKQCASNSKEINNLKDQLSSFIKTQLDFQQKIENQITTLQTMMQTVCQLINNEIISNRKFNGDFESRSNWLNNAQRPYLIAKDTTNAMDELLLFTRRMNNGTPIDSNLFHPSKDNRHSTNQPSTNETNGNENSKPTHQHKYFDPDSHSLMISPINAPLLYDMFQSGTSNGSILRNGISTTVPSASTSETILEKILQERLRLVQQMAELNKQHEKTQDELTNLETKTVQT